MNSILQCLSVTEKLRDVLSGEKEVVRKAKKQSRSLVKGAYSTHFKHMLLGSV